MSAKSNRPKIVLSINTAWNIVNFRTGLIRGLEQAGFDVVCAAPPDDYATAIRAIGARFEPIAIDSDGTSPFRDFSLAVRYWRLFRRERPSVFLGFTAKPNIFGSIAARSAGVPVIANISGLGTAFIRKTVLTVIVKRLYRMALSHATTVFFQNEDDRSLFAAQGLVDPEKTALLPGSGIDLDRFQPIPRRAPEPGDATVFLLIARLVYDKGVREFADAARAIRRSHPHARCQLLGFLDVKNRTAVARVDVDGWVEAGVLEYLGTAEDVRSHIAAADCVVLPSYREGTPRSLLEAAAMGRPLIATDVPGCREPVMDGENGYLCEVRNTGDLARAMGDFLALSSEQKQEMGRRSREIAVARYDERIVIAAYAAAIAKALSICSRH